MIDLRDFEGLERSLPLDLTGDEAGFVVIDAQGNHVRLAPGAYHLLRAVRAGVGFEELAERMRRQGRQVSAEQLRTAYDDVSRRLVGIAARPPSSRLPPGFWLRLPLLGEGLVTRVATALAFLFRRKIALATSLAAALIIAAAWPGTPTFAWDARAFWGGYGLFLLSLLAHELGHAAACAHFGVRPRDVGFTVYLIYPAFYSDVTRAWRLGRGQRVVVDLGGIYFQLIAGAGFALGHFLGGGAVFAAAFWMILLSVLFALNPIFRFDGYWVLADALGVASLGRQPARLVRRLYRRLRGRPVGPLPWPGWVQAVLVAYTPLSFAVWLYFILRLTPEIGARAAGYPALLRSVATPLARGETPAGPDLHTLASSTFLLLIAAIMAWRLLALAAGVRRRGHAGEGGPRVDDTPLVGSRDAEEPAVFSSSDKG